jgi:hypothetical protein
MNKPLIALSAGLLLLAACDRVDKAGTADKLITNLERTQNTTLAPAQRTCVKDLVKSYGDSELKALSKNTASEAVLNGFVEKIQTCLRGADASTTTTAVLTTTAPGETTTVPGETTTVPAAPATPPTTTG